MPSSSEAEKLPVPYVRELQPGDVSFIYDSWLKSYKGANDRKKAGLPGWRYWDHYRGIIDQLMAREEAEFLVLCDFHNPSFIYGWICFERPGPFGVIHYIFVKRDFRRVGFATRLLREPGLDLSRIVYTFPKYANLAESKFVAVTYTPVERWLE